MDWILNPVALYCLSAATLVGSLALFLSVKFEVSALHKEYQGLGVTVTGRLDATEAGLEVVRQSVANAEERAFAAIHEQNQAFRPALNLTRRGQAIRMHRRGESIPTIAAALRTPLNEIELLIKVQELQR